MKEFIKPTQYIYKIESEERFVRAISFFAVSPGLAACQARRLLRELATGYKFKLYIAFILRGLCTWELKRGHSILMYQSISKAIIPTSQAYPGQLTGALLRTLGNLTQNEAYPVEHSMFVSTLVVASKKIS